MQFASSRRSKMEALTLVTASLLFSAAADQIKTGIVAFTDHVVSWMPPTANKGRAWSTLTALWDLSVTPSPTALLPAVDHLIGTLKRTTLVLIVSDFMTDENLEASRALRVLASRHDVVAVVVGDKAEGRLPAGSGFVRVRDLESGGEMTLKLNNEVRARYAGIVGRRRDDL